MESGMEEGMEGRMEERMEEEMEGGMKGGMEGGMKGGMEEGVASRNLSANVGMAVPRGVNHTVSALGQGWCRVVAGLALVLAGTVLGGFAPAHGFAWQLCRTAWLLSSWLGPSTRFWPSPGPPGATLPPLCHLPALPVLLLEQRGSQARRRWGGSVLQGLLWPSLM